MTGKPQSGVLGELDPLVGLTISGRYRVHGLLGQGGMGKVFRAQQIPLGRAVALKVLEASRVDQEFHRRFFQEAAILAKLQSQHTVTIYDYGRDGDLYFIAMELVAGGSLDRELAAQGPLPVLRVLSIAQQICRSLREAHGQGVVHRDLKPGNVVITRAEDGEELVKVLDFGLAKRLNSAIKEETQSDTVPGSPKYMAPEVIRQQPVDGRADIYSLGVMLYQMLAGKVPFDRESPIDILLAHLHEQPLPLRQANAGVGIPPKVEHMVMRCLAKTPEQRYANVRELTDVLRALAHELGAQSQSSWPGGALASDPAPSGVRPSAGQRLRLEGADVARVAPRQPARGARLPALAAAGALLATGAAAYLLLSPPDAQQASESPLIAAPPPEALLPSAAAAGAQAPSEPALAPADMVFTTEDVGARAVSRVALRVTSDPPGALVLVRGKRMGTTPASFELRGPAVRAGGSVSLQLELNGYETRTVRRTVDAPELEIAAKLVPLRDQADLNAVDPASTPDESADTPTPVLEIKPVEEPEHESGADSELADDDDEPPTPAPSEE